MIRGALLALGTALLSGAATMPTVAPGYQPQDEDERGLWMQVDEAERQLRTSNFVMRDPALNAYVRGVFCRTVGAADCAGVRLYIVRTPYFNASMAPNGMMLVYSGLFLRVQDEAQLAAVLGHEYTHYRNRHSLRNFRDLKGKANAMAWLSVVPVANYGAFAAMGALRYGVLSSIFAFSREMESEADAGSIPLMAQAGYDPREAWRVWQQIRDEQDATAAARNRESRKDKDRGLFATHPSSAERMATLKALGEKQAVAGPVESGRDRYRAALAPWWATFIDDQIKLNDFGATDYLIANLAREGWTPELLYARGELYRSRGRPEDLKAAVECLRKATAAPDAPVEAWRGLGLALLREGETTDGQAALRDYLARRPDATDKAMLTMLAGGPG